MNWGGVWSFSEALIGNLPRIPFNIRGLSAMILGLLLAKWFWIFFSPLSTFTAVAPDRSNSIEAGKIFGITQTAEAVSPGTTLSNVQLLGVFTGSAGRAGFAIMKVDSKQMGVAEGEEFSGGTKLTAVYADYVMLERGGVKQRVELENKYANSTTTTPGASTKKTGATSKNKGTTRKTPAKPTSSSNAPNAAPLPAFGAAAAGNTDATVSDGPYNKDPAKDAKIREIHKQLDQRR